MLKDFNEIAEMQRELDTRIAEKFNITESTVIDEKMLALMVEFGELANEVRSFKFWSQTKKDNQSDIFEEYVDGIHFLLSIGNFLGKNHSYPINEVQGLNKKEMTKLFNDTFLSIAELAKDKNEHNYDLCMNKYLSLGSAIGLSYENIISEYKNKNKKNHIRQDQNY